LLLCDPRAEDILVVDSSSDESVAAVVAEHAHDGVRLVRFPKRGLGYAFNHGLAEARHALVLLTNDDCTVDPDWVRAGVAAIGADAGLIVTGRVRPAGDPKVVPSTIDEDTAQDYRGRLGFFLYTQCMAVRRDEVLAFGGFDGRIRPSAEDNDLSYRWLRAGHRIRYAPEFVVWHHDWRSPGELERLYVDYGIGQGMVYAKHLRTRDRAVLRFVARDLYAVARGVADRAIRGRRPHGDWRLGLGRGLPVGLARGWRTYGRTTRPDAW
jgi:GT2 family glycosyltransferase